MCGKTEDVIEYPDDHALTVCPECCDKATHHDGETGHGWYYDRHERGRLCRYCGLPKQCTPYSWED